jgi:hypothetical protein
MMGVEANDEVLSVKSDGCGGGVNTTWSKANEYEWLDTSA